MDKNEANSAHEKLTDDVVTRLVGHTNVVYYNFETNAWNMDKYNGCWNFEQERDTAFALDFKDTMERWEPSLFCAKYEIVASVTMTINGASFPGWGKTITNPSYSNMGTAVVGSIIVRNKATGKYELYCKSWFGVDKYLDSYIASVRGAFDFVRFGIREVLLYDGVGCKQILSRTRVVTDDKAPQVTSVEKPVAPAKTNRTPEKLTDDVVRRLVGHTNVVYYNFETNAWNTNRFDICKVPNKPGIIKEVKTFKAVMEGAFEFDNQYEIVAPVTMMIKATAYSGYAEKVSNLQYNRTAKTFAGNIIVRNKETGRYELYCKYWVGGRCLFFSKDVADIYGAWYFALNGVYKPLFRTALLAAHTR